MQRENSLDLEFNQLRGQITLLKEKAQGSHLALSNFSRKIAAFSKRKEISEAYSINAEKEVRKIIQTVEAVLKTLK